MNRFIFILIISVILSIATGCSADSVSSMSKKNDSSTLSSTPNQSSDTTSSTRPTDNMPTVSSTQSSGDVSTTPPTTSSQSETSNNTGDEKMDNNCKLIVMGRDITSENYVHLNDERRDVELPLTAVMKELGAKVEWQNKTTVVISFDGDDFVLDTEKQDFGLPRPPGSTHFVRQVIGNEVIIDGTSATGLIVHWMGAKISIDYDNQIINIG